MLIVTTLALSLMALNQLLLPASYPDPDLDLYRWLLWGRRVLIAMIILAAYGFYVLLVFAVVHVAAVVVTELRGGGNLVSAMFSGTKLLSRSPADRS